MKEIRMAGWADTYPFTPGERRVMECFLEISQVGSSGERGNSTARNQLLLASQAFSGIRVGGAEFLIRGIQGGLFVLPGNCYKGGYSPECSYDIYFQPKFTDRWGGWLPRVLNAYLVGGRTLEEAAEEANVPYARFRNRLEGMKDRLQKGLGLNIHEKRETSWLIKALAVTGRLKLTRSGFRSTEAVC